MLQIVIWLPILKTNIWHAYNTNINENMDMVIAKYAPKPLHLSDSISLETRASIAAGCQINGYEQFWKDVLSCFDIPMTESLVLCLKRIDIIRNKKRDRNNMNKNKLKRSEKVREQIKKEIDLDKIACNTGNT